MYVYVRNIVNTSKMADIPRIHIHNNAIMSYSQINNCVYMYFVAIYAAMLRLNGTSLEPGQLRRRTETESTASEPSPSEYQCVCM